MIEIEFLIYNAKLDPGLSEAILFREEKRASTTLTKHTSM